MEDPLYIMCLSNRGTTSAECWSDSIAEWLVCPKTVLGLNRVLKMYQKEKQAFVRSLRSATFFCFLVIVNKLVTHQAETHWSNQLIDKPKRH